MKDPSKIPAKVKDELKGIGLWDIHPRNLFRINWHNQPTASGGTFGGVNFLELPSALTGVPARIIAIESTDNENLITTTDIHLARDLGEALHHACGGELEFHYNEDQKLLRVHWQR